MRATVARAALATVLLACVAAAAQPEAIPVVIAPVVDIPRATFHRGSDAHALDRAVALCRDHSDGNAAIACTPDLIAIEHPQREITVSAFRIDRTEVTERAYLACVAEGACRAPRDLPRIEGFRGPDLPVVGVSWDDARRYCARAAGRLPTEAEWERVARGTDLRLFPWGDTWDSRCANHGRSLRRVDGSDGFRGLAPVTSFASCVGPSGVLGLAGNAAEWVEDAFVPDGYERSSAIDPRTHEGSGLRIVRGGSFLSMPHELRVSARRIEAEDAALVDVGFRCAYGARSP